MGRMGPMGHIGRASEDEDEDDASVFRERGRGRGRFPFAHLVIVAGGFHELVGVGDR